MKKSKRKGRLFSEAWSILKESYNEFVDDKAFKMAAALSYYASFSLAPMLIIVIAIAGFFFGEDAAQGQIVVQMKSLIGADGALFIQNMIKGASTQSQGIIATIIGIVLLVMGSLGVFIELQESLNIIWGVEMKPGRGIWGFVKNRLISFSLVVALGFLMIIFLLINTLLTLLYNYVGTYIAGLIPFAEIVNSIISFIVITFLFGIIYKVLPDVNLRWKYVRLGAIITSVLFTIGKYLIGLYIGNNSYSSTFGAAGSLVILFVWIYYSGLIIFLGAEITQVYRRNYDDAPLEADRDAILVTKTSTLIQRAIKDNPNAKKIDVTSTCKDENDNEIENNKVKEKNI